MTPMLRELHEAHKERLERMKARHIPTVLAIPKKILAEEPEQTSPAAPAPGSVTPVSEIESPAMPEGASVKIRQIQAVVAKRYRLELDEIVSDSRNQFVMLPRQIAYALSKRLTLRSYPEIGRAFGRDHTTIMHGANKIEKRARKDPAFAAELTQLEWVIMGKTQLPCPCCGSIASPPTSPDDNTGNGEAGCS